MSLLPYLKSLQFTEETLRMLRDTTLADPLLNDAERFILSSDIYMLCDLLSFVCESYRDHKLDASAIIKSRNEQR